MYEAYFNLTIKPFDILPNPDFLYLSKSHKRAITYLGYGLRERAGFILLTGEIGSGKTTLIRDLLKKQPERTIISKIFNTRADSDQLVAMINDDFGLPIIGKDKITMLRELNEFLIEQYARGNQPVLIIDEAQNLTADLLEEVRMLSNLETDNAKLLQIILSGQPELRKTLAAPELLQLRQRISINCNILPLSRIETEHYILHRLEVAGNRNAVTFSSDALDLIFTYSKGVPRLINIICDFLMLSAYAEETKDLGAEMVRDIAGDLDFENHFWGEGKSEAIYPSTDLSLSVGRDNLRLEGELTAALKEISTRLDNLETQTQNSNSTLMKEFGEKLTSLENAFRFHVEETDASVIDIKRNIEKMKSDQDKEGDQVVDHDPGKTGFIRRIFGS